MAFSRKSHTQFQGMFFPEKLNYSAARRPMPSTSFSGCSLRLNAPTLLALSALLAAPMLTAAPLAASQRAEIDALMATLQSSACEFNRNDTWHNAADAKTHLLRKLDYLEGKDAVHSTEQFIDLGASKSSLSGQPYQVRCGTAAPVDSKSWLSLQLKLIRSPLRPVALPPR